MFDLHLKKLAKEKLRGIYRGAFLGQLVCYIPAYLISLVIMLLAIKNNNVLATLAVGFIGEIFVLDIFSVGYIRSLIEADGKPQTDEKRYDINTVLSGFSENYTGTLKTMFLRRLYLFGWSVMMFLPMIIAVGVIAFLSYRPEISQVINYMMQINESPTIDMMINTGNYMAQNCAYVIYIFGGALLLSIVLAIPYVRKVYLYEMIPMIIAESPKITSEEAFDKTKEIMTGYRLKYFLLELSFIGILLIVEVVGMLVPQSPLIYIAMALAYPYIIMTFVQFYLSRTRVETEEITPENKTETDK